MLTTANIMDTTKITIMTTMKVTGTMKARSMGIIARHMTNMNPT
jgi:hypothetical protein